MKSTDISLIKAALRDQAFVGSPSRLCACRQRLISGLKKLAPPPGSSYPLLIVDATGQPVFFLCEWYRRQKEVNPGRTSDTYLDMVLP